MIEIILKKSNITQDKIATKLNMDIITVKKNTNKLKEK
jgi:predicted transcriptional regulator